jgi:hypothetical protein
MTSVLHGRIVYRFQLPFTETNCREKRSNATTVSTAVTGNNNDVSSEYKHKRCLNDNHIAGHTNCGFIFIPDVDLHLHKEYLLSLPKRLLKLAYDAVRLERKVMIKRYTKIPFVTNYDNSVSTSSSSPSKPCAIIEVHELEIFPVEFPEMAEKARKSGRSDTSDRNAENNDNVWTLTQFWRKEQIDFQKIKNSRPKFSLLATVDAISPIVAFDPSNPFALVEVYDKENTDVTCVVVLHGKQAMLNHAVIHPLDTLVFHDVVYKPWAVHKALYDDKNMDGSTSSTFNRRFIGRIPSHVFVATGANNVSWNNQGFEIIQHVSSSRNACPSSRHQSQSGRAQNGIPPTITPLHLVTTILGKIYNVETLSVRSGGRTTTVIHYLDMILLNQSMGGLSDKNNDDDVNGESPSTRPRCRLYLSYFPMSVTLQYSLRSEGIVQAHNVHLVSSQEKSCFDFDADNKIMASYGACLRSTLLLLKHATDATMSPAKENGEQLMQVTQNMESCIKNDAIAASTPLFTQPCKELSISMKTKSSVLHSKRFALQGRKNTGLDALSKDHGGSKKEDSLINPPFTFVNYGFRRIHRTHLHEMYFEHVKDWEHRSFQGSLRVISQKDRAAECVPRTWIVNVLLGTNHNNWSTKSKVNGHCGSGDNPTSYIPLITNRRVSIRSPYAEFFDHPFCLRVDDDGASMQNLSCSCHLSMEDRKTSSSRSSALLDLNGIRTASQCYFENHISKLLLSQNVESLHQLQKGFHGSIRVPLRKLYAKHWKDNYIHKESEIDAGNDGANNCFYFVGGFVSEVHAPTSSVASIADGACQIPICFDKKPCYANTNDFIMGQFDSVMISCLCLGNLMTESNKDHKDKSTSFLDSVSISKSLPSLNSRENDLLGNCTLVTINGFLFVTAIQIQCREYQLHKVIILSPSKKQEEMDLEDVTFTVDNCLVRKDFLSESSKSVTLMGMLTRCRFYSKMNVDGSHKCCRLTLSSLRKDESDDIESDNSCLQALELTVSVEQSTSRMVKFNEMLAIVWPKVNLIRSQKVLALSFWVLGDSGRTCAMTFGGSEDNIPGSLCSKSIVKVTFPSSSLQLKNLGYIRPLCTHDCLDAFFENRCHSDEDDQPRNTISKNASIPSFDFVGGLKVINGMLHRRPFRRNIFRPDINSLRRVGELSTEPSNAIPLNTLSDLFELVFQGLREPNTSERTMNPSLVRRVSKGRFLSVSFCQVQCYCTQCFCSVVSSSSNATEEAARIRKRKREHPLYEPSFWHLPRPEESLLGIDRTSGVKSGIADRSSVILPQHVRFAKLRCPKNNCPKHVFGVKWECSGVLDDGTGQATMYADGDAALTLLGMSAESIEMIEKGAWSMRDGSIQFMKAIPPPKHIRDKVIDILYARRRHDLKESAMADPLGLLSIQDRAIYLLERHCRSSSRPRRHLDYYVRCKPLVNKKNMIPHVRHTTIDSFFEDCGNNSDASTIIYRGQVASYTIPSLKLELVDCGLQSLECPCTNSG